MMCCVCEGVCMHVGPHSYCAAHGGVDAPTRTTTTNISSPLLIRTATEMCNHCYCETANDGMVPMLLPRHRRCCKCRDTMHEQFLDGPRQPA